MFSRIILKLVNDLRTIGQLPNIIYRIDPTKFASGIIETVFRN